MDSSSNPHDRAHDLARAIVAHETYEAYRLAKKQIEQKTELKERIGKIRALQMELDCAQISGHILPEGQVKTIRSEIEELGRDERIAYFFVAESRFIQFFNELQGIIQKAIEQNFEQ